MPMMFDCSTTRRNGTRHRTRWQRGVPSPGLPVEGEVDSANHSRERKKESRPREARLLADPRHVNPPKVRPRDEVCTSLPVRDNSVLHKKEQRRGEGFPAAVGGESEAFHLAK